MRIRPALRLLMIERLREATIKALIRNKFSRTSSKISISHGIKNTWPNVYKGLKIMAQYLQRIKTFFGSRTKSVSQEWRHINHCSRLGNALSLCLAARPSDPPKLCRSAAPRARALNLQSKPSILFWKSLCE